MLADSQTSVARQTPVFGVRGSYLANTVNLQDRRLPSGFGARVQGRTADLNGGGLRGLAGGAGNSDMQAFVRNIGFPPAGKRFDVLFLTVGFTP